MSASRRTTARPGGAGVLDTGGAGGDTDAISASAPSHRTPARAAACAVVVARAPGLLNSIAPATATSVIHLAVIGCLLRPSWRPVHHADRPRSGARPHGGRSGGVVGGHPASAAVPLPSLGNRHRARRTGGRSAGASRGRRGL